jgi:hypothetical protein
MNTKYIAAIPLTLISSFCFAIPIVSTYSTTINILPHGDQSKLMISMFESKTKTISSAMRKSILDNERLSRKGIYCKGTTTIYVSDATMYLSTIIPLVGSNTGSIVRELCTSNATYTDYQGMKSIRRKNQRQILSIPPEEFLFLGNMPDGFRKYRINRTTLEYRGISGRWRGASLVFIYIGSKASTPTIIKWQMTDSKKNTKLLALYNITWHNRVAESINVIRYDSFGKPSSRTTFKRIPSKIVPVPSAVASFFKKSDLIGDLRLSTAVNTLPDSPRSIMYRWPGRLISISELESYDIRQYDKSMSGRSPFSTTIIYYLISIAVLVASGLLWCLSRVAMFRRN